MKKTIIAFTSAIILLANGFSVNNNYAYSRIFDENESSYRLDRMSIPNINRLLEKIANKSFVERIEIISEREKGTPYVLGPLGEGAKSPYDKNPLMDLGRVDCVTFVEQTLALAMSKSYPEAFDILQKIRYKDKEIKIEKRNHYFMADWVVNNSWFVNDVTKEIGGNYTKPVTRTISHKDFFANSVYKGITAQEPDRTMTINYIPKADLPLIKDKLQSGDIAAFVIDLPNIFVSHTGLIIKDNKEKVFFRNATSINQKQVVDLPYNDLVEYLKNSKKNLGMVFIRPRLEEE